MKPTHTDRARMNPHIGLSVNHASFSSYPWPASSLTRLLFKISALTIPYFSLTEQLPATDCAPRSPSGVFGIDAMGRKYIREELSSLSRSGGVNADEPSLMAVLNCPQSVDPIRS